MDKIMKKPNKLLLPATILIASIILGGFYYASEVNKQKSIERQEEVKAEQVEKEYLAKRKVDCYNIEQGEREKSNRVKYSRYDEEKDVCIVAYYTDKYKEVDCEEYLQSLIEQDDLFISQRSEQDRITAERNPELLWRMLDRRQAEYTNCIFNHVEREF